MGLLRRLANRFDPVLETRAEPSWDALRGLTVAAGHSVNPRTAEGLSVVLACVAGISTGIASLPAYVYRSRPDGGGRDEDGAHPLARMIRRGPNPWQTWPDLIEWTVASALLRGNAVLEGVWDRAGRLQELRPVPWDYVTVLLLPSGKLAYDVEQFVAMDGRTAGRRRLLAEDVIHLKDRSDDGMVGRSRLSRAAATIGAALSVQTFSSSMFENGVHPSGVIQAEGLIGPEALKNLRERFTKAFSGPHNAARALVLDQNLKWTSISVSPEDAELLASRRFSTEELARIFQVPPPLVGIWDHSSFTNAETAGRWFAQHTLAPWIRKIEATFSRALLPADRELVIDLSGFLRGDPESRWRSYDVALKHGVLTRNEVRGEEGWNPTPDGDSPPEAPA